MNFERPVCATCGENVIFPAARVGCGKPIYTCNEVYRCTECHTPFHHECAVQHFGIHDSKYMQTMTDAIKEPQT